MRRDDRKEEQEEGGQDVVLQSEGEPGRWIGKTDVEEPTGRHDLEQVDFVEGIDKR